MNLPLAFQPQLVALDLDGTLLTSGKNVSQRSAQAIQNLQEQGVRVILCTGRPPRHVRDIATDLGLAELVISYNGASLINFATDEIQHLYTLKKDQTQEAILRIRSCFPEVMAGLETAYGWFLDSSLLTWRQDHLPPQTLLPDGCGDICDFVQDGVIKVFFRHTEYRASELATALEGLELYCTWSGDRLLEVQHPLVNKQQALAHLANKLGIPVSAIATFGDEHNDREMLRWAGLGVAMGNAPLTVQACADLVTLSNDEDGVAVVLEHLLEQLA